ncbi:MAG: hypothetical protein JWM12_757 [Ilumatobacteraceae bacterium]|nr:hypothetical protein [Ilumatobacteraceae bacterium]
MPGPSSSTMNVPAPSAIPTDTCTSNRAYFSAFSIRFAATWASRSGSASTGTGGPGATRRDTSRSLASGAKPDAAVVAAAARSIGTTCSENARVCSLARSSRSATRRSSRRDSERITSAATIGSAAPSVIASAYPRIDVSGVRRSWLTESRNCCSSTFERSNPSAIPLMLRASSAISSCSPARGAGTRVVSWPAAIRCVAADASRIRRVKVRPSSSATRSPSTSTAAAVTRNERTDAPSPALASWVSTTTTTLPFSARVGAAANTMLPWLPLTTCRRSSAAGSMSSRVMPVGSSAASKAPPAPEMSTAMSAIGRIVPNERTSRSRRRRAAGSVTVLRSRTSSMFAATLAASVRSARSVVCLARRLASTRVPPPTSSRVAMTTPTITVARRRVIVSRCWRRGVSVV